MSSEKKEGNRTRRFSLTVRASRGSTGEPKSGTLTSRLFGKQKKEEGDDEKRRSAKMSVLQEIKERRHSDRTSGNMEWPQPGKVDSSGSLTKSPSPRVGAEEKDGPKMVRVLPASFTLPDVTKSRRFVETYETDFAKYLEEAEEQHGIGALYKTSPAVLIQEFENNRSGQLNVEDNNFKSSVLIDTVRSICKFYTSPWVSLEVCGGPLSYAWDMPALLKFENSRKLELARDVFRIPLIPFLAEGAARHFLVENFEAKLANFGGEPMVASLAIYDREISQKLTGDMCVYFPGSLSVKQLPAHLREKPKALAHKAVFSVPSASREVFFVVQLYKLVRSSGTLRKSDQDMKSLSSDQKKSYDAETLKLLEGEETSLLWEPFAVGFCPTLRESDREGYTSARGGPVVKRMEPVSGRLEIREVHEFGSSSTQELMSLLNEQKGDPCLLEGSLSMDVEVEWSSDNKNAFLDGFVEVAQAFTPSLSVGTGAKNDLYVYPAKIVGNAKLFAPDACLYVKVFFKPNKDEAEKALMYKCSVMGCDAVERKFGWTSVAHCWNGTGEFLDEIRLQLPTVLEAEAALYFEIWQVEGAGLDQKRLNTFSIPLLSENTQFLADGMHSVLLGVDNLSGTYTKRDTLNLPAFKFATRFVSTLYLQDATSSSVIKNLGGPNPVITNVESVPRAIERRNFPILLSGLLNVMYSTNMKQPVMSMSAFCEAVGILERLHMSYPDSSSSHHPYIQSFTSYVFVPPGRDFANVLLDTWLMVITQPPSASLKSMLVLSRTWVLLDILMKSIVLSKSVTEISALQNRVVKTAVKKAKGSRREKRSQSRGVSDRDMEVSLSVSPLRINVPMKFGGAAGRKMSDSPSSSPQMRRKPSTSDNGDGSAEGGGKQHCSVEAIKEMRKTSDESQLQLKELLGRLLMATATYESSDSVKLSVLEVGKVIRTAFSCLDRGFCLDMLNYVLECMDLLGWSDLTVDVLAIVFGMGSDFLMINMPGPVGLGKLSDYQTDCEQRYPLIGVLVKRLREDIVKERVGSSGTIWLLVALLSNHFAELSKGKKEGAGKEDSSDEEDNEDSSDEESSSTAWMDRMLRSNGSALKEWEVVASMYFSFVQMTLEMFESSQLVLDASVDNCVPWFTATVFVLCNISEELRHMWYFVESTGGISNYFAFLLAGCKICKGTPIMGEVCRRVVDLVEDFAQDSMTGAAGSGNSLAPNLFGLLNFLFDICGSLNDESFSVKLFQTAKVVVEQNLAIVFEEQHAPYCQMLVIPTIAMCMDGSAKLREKAAAFLWNLIESNDFHRQNFIQVKLACTIAISRLVTEKRGGDTYLLKEALDRVTVMAKDTREELQEQIKEMKDRLFSVLKSTSQLSEFENEPEMKVDICFSISEGYSGSPDLRVTWLKIIGALHKSNKDFLEAGQAYLVVAYLIAQYLRLAKRLPSGLLTAEETLLRICPSLSSPKFVGISLDDVENNATALRLEVWTLEGFGNMLFEAAQLLADAQLYSWSLDCYNMIIALRKPLAQYLDLLKAYAGAQMACKNLLKASGTAATTNNLSESKKKKAAAIEAKYFRVKFVGAAFEKINDKAFIYRGDPSQRLMDFSSFMVKKCQDNSSAYGTSKVELLGNDKEVTENLLKQSETLYLQVARVYPTASKDEEEEDDVVVSEFFLDMAHSEEKKQQQMVASQGRKKLYFTTAVPFPGLSRRIEVTETRLVILTPLQNAVEIMIDRVNSVKDAVASNNATVISGLLYGNLMTTISEGPEAVAEGFLKPGFEKSEETDKLQGLVKDFIQYTSSALDVHEKLMSADMKEWQATARDRFETLKGKLAAFL